MVVLSGIGEVGNEKMVGIVRVCRTECRSEVGDLG